MEQKPTPVALSNDPVVQEALENKDTQSPEIIALIAEWEGKTEALAEIRRQFQLFQQQINKLQVEFQTGVGLINGIELSIKSFIEAQKKEEPKPKKKSKKASK